MVSAMSGEPAMPGEPARPGDHPGGRFADVRRFDTIDSTNRYLLDQARTGAVEGLVAVADHQSAGRGRLGRRWEAPPGGCLLVSLLLRPALEPRDLHLCTALVALAAADACATVSGVAPGIKWPNDLVLPGGKVAGVLAESEPAPAGSLVESEPAPAGSLVESEPAPAGSLVESEPASAGSLVVVVGVGINVTWDGPPGVGGTSLATAAGRPVDREALLEALLAGVADRRPALNHAPGRAALAAELARRCVTVGQRVRVETADGPFEGLAVGLNDGGHLLVEVDGRPVEVAAGDVVHLRPTGPAGPRERPELV
jgi:BirA family biotin operon repressor/biotin-[acetyl-CoA-carboxylase] ligase